MWTPIFLVTDCLPRGIEDPEMRQIWAPISLVAGSLPREIDDRKPRQMWTPFPPPTIQPQAQNRPKIIAIRISAEFVKLSGML